MFKFIKTSVISIISLLGFIALPALACETGNQCPTTTPVPTTTFTIGAVAVNGGFAAGLYEGSEGYGYAETLGSAEVNQTLGAEGNLCGLDCTSGNWTVQAETTQTSLSGAGALSNQSGVQASAVNQGMANSAISISLLRSPD